MNETKLEQLLSSYVTEGRTERVKLEEGHAAMTRTLFTIQSQVALMDQKNDNGFATIHASLRGLDSRVTKLESNVEDTGKHNIEDLRMQLREAKARVSWWGKYKVQTLTAIGMLVLGAILSTCATLAIRVASVPQRAVAPAHGIP